MRRRVSMGRAYTASSSAVKVSRRVGVLALAGLTLALAEPAHAGNGRSYELGNDAAIMGGTGVARSVDGAAAWYNPAGLAAIERYQLDVSGSAFMLRFRKYPSIMEATDGVTTRSVGISDTEFVAVPTSLVFARRVLPKLVLGFGLFVPEMAEVSSQDGFDDLPVQGGSFGMQLDFASKVRSFHVGFALGGELGGRVRLGLGLFGVYRKTQSRVRLLENNRPTSPATPETSAAFIVFEDDDNRSVIGGLFTVGAQWEFIKGWHLGVTVRSPLWQFGQFGDRTTVNSGAQTTDRQLPPASFTLSKDNLRKTGGGTVLPVEIHVAVAAEFPGGYVALEADFMPPVENEELSVDSRFAWNVRAGVRYQFTERFAAGLGLFTDRTTAPPAAVLGDEHVDYYGVTLGGEYRKPIQLGSREEAKTLVFSTTFGVRYAFGLGQFGAYKIDLARPNASPDVVRDAVLHELSLHLGSTLLF